ncbi:ATPase, AAA family [Treponema primitia ZAS-2]|uniref:ATPase, AAA family n=1 Tax=Treponema primitia (strain ATCC BAA-887 / DSM 12427 / ZAS-2) TaxID=545694 RepID=F5YL52_TREPZ|nr:ATP-binding protein [Treponema primitia]AEF84252.1 ATPase, AAA family [Treponema primitia ZAS-2]
MNKETTGVLDHCKEIISHSAYHPLDAAFFADAAQDLAAVGDLFSITPTQAALFTLLLDECGNGAISINTIADKIKCGRIQFLKYLDDFEALEQKHLIRPEKDWEDFSSKRSGGSSFPSYSIPLDVIKALRAEKEYRYAPYSSLTPEEFFETAGELLESFRNSTITRNSLESELKILLNSNQKINFVKGIKTLSIRINATVLLLFFCCSYIEDKENISFKTLQSIFKHLGRRILATKFRNRDNQLFETGLIENECDRGMADTEYYKLTPKAREVFLADINLKEKSKQSRNLIKAETLKPRDLFYNEKTDRCIKELGSLLREENFAAIKQRFAEKNLRSGFTCIFTGAPGTGKTETVYALARETGRDIMLVDISETKSMWFGESEKRIKEIFDRYHGLIKGRGLTPILFFNEADAVLGKRQELGEVRRGPAQTENAIQNIILQEMEDLAGGILIATTNMADNLDKAFERRFLYKIEFEKPDIRAKTAIWKSNLPGLTEVHAETLAQRFDFSGGQIENIIRKETVSSLLSGIEADPERLIRFCEEEVMVKDKTKTIGFEVG